MIAIQSTIIPKTPFACLDSIQAAYSADSAAANNVSFSSRTCAWWGQFGKMFQMSDNSRYSFWDKLTLFVATGFGIGFVVPFAPGTFGSAAGVALAYAVAKLPLSFPVVNIAAIS